MQAAASTVSPGTGGSSLYPGSGGLPDLSSLFGSATTGGAGGTGLFGAATTGGAGGTGLGAMGLGSGNFAEMQRQVGWSFQSMLITFR